MQKKCLRSAFALQPASHLICCHHKLGHDGKVSTSEPGPGELLPLPSQWYYGRIPACPVDSHLEYTAHHVSAGQPPPQTQESLNHTLPPFYNICAGQPAPSIPH